MKTKMELLLSLPYALLFWAFDRLAALYRLAPGDVGAKTVAALGKLFDSPCVSLDPLDMLVGLAGAGAVYLYVRHKAKHAKKFRHDVEYGSARWGNAEDIRPYIAPAFKDNIILTQTERLTMNSRPKDPKTARNKNVLVIGGSGSGKTRFFIKPSASVRAE